MPPVRFSISTPRAGLVSPTGARMTNCETNFSLLIYPHLKDDEVDEIIEVVRAAI